MAKFLSLRIKDLGITWLSEKTETVSISIPVKWWKKIKSTELLFVVFSWNQQSIVMAATLILIFRDIIKLGMFTAQESIKMVLLFQSINC